MFAAQGPVEAVTIWVKEGGGGDWFIRAYNIRVRVFGGF